MSDVHAAVGSYVADALEADERAEFEAHLAVCASCRREVAELSEAAAELSVLAQTPPPADVRSGVLSAIGTVRPLPPDEEPVRPGPDPAPAATADTPGADRRRRSTRWLAVAAAAALVIAVAFGGWGLSLQQERRAQVAEQRAEADLLSAPDLRVHSVSLADGTAGSYLVSASRDRGLFLAAAPASTPPGHTYQVWTVHDGEPVGSGLFEEGEQVRIWIDNVSGAEAVAITIEPDGGSPQPTTEEMAQAEL